MGKEEPVTRSERVLLAAVLPLGGGLVMLLFAGVFLTLTNLPDGVLELLRPAGVLCFALGAPLFMRIARPFSALRRSLAGLVGLATGLAVTGALISMGVVAHAMNHIGEAPACLNATEALLHEGTLMVLAYGSAILAGFLALGTARQVQTPAQTAPSQRTATPTPASDGAASQ